MAERIEMPVRGLSQVDQRNHVLDAGADPQCEGQLLWIVHPTKRHWEFLLRCTQKTAEPIEMPFGKG